MPRYPKSDGSNEDMTKSMVFRSMYLAVFESPITTGSMGIPAFAYSSLWTMAKLQKWDGVQKNMVIASKTGSRHNSAAADAPPARTAKLPANPPIIIFNQLFLLSHAV